MKTNHFSFVNKVFLLFTSLLFLFASCKFFSSLDEPVDNTIAITSLSLGKENLNTSIGNMEYLSVSVKPTTAQKDIKLNWTYDESFLSCDTSSSWGITFTPLKEGRTSIRCSYGGYDASCMINIEGYSDTYLATVEPYIYSNFSILQTTPGISEKVFVSLYGGDASDLDGYSWSVDNPSVASIQPTGQYCVITAKEAGYARIKITHNKASYPYYMGIYVFADATQISYITTTNNIVTMNQGDGEQNISLSLVNGKESSNNSQFTWEILKEDGIDNPVGISWNGNNAVITPIKSGSCTLRVSHPDASYPLDILCRVITIVKNVYIKPNSTVVTLTGENTETISCSLENIKDGEYNLDGFNYSLDSDNVAEIISYVGNEVTLKGLANGSCKLNISHEKSEYSREVLVIVNGQLNDAVDASCFVTTSQNYIKTKVGAPETALKINLKGGYDGDEKNFTWSVKSTAADGSTDDVINLNTTHGSVIYSRAAVSTYTPGEAFITPVKEGTAVITITHPKIVYPTEILVKVLNKDAVLEEPLYFSGPGLIKILNGTTANYYAELKGDNKNSSDDSSISWECDTDLLKIAANGNEAQISAPSLGTGSTMSYITVTHPKAETPKKVLVMTADDEETLDSMKALYSDKLYYNIEVGEKVSCNLNTAGFEAGYDFSKMTWKVKDSSIISVEKSSMNPLVCNITGLKSGVTTLTASIDGVSCDFTITVYPKGTVAIKDEVYFSTSQNVITMGGKGESTTAYITALNLDSKEYSNISWTSDNEDVATVIGNGTSATISAMAEGEAVISIMHKDSQNVLKIYVRVGSEYIIPEAEPLIYISSPDVMTFLKDGGVQTLQAVLVNGPENPKGFAFEIDNNSVATITAQTETGIAYVKPVGSGQAQITITNTATEITKKVLVVVGNSAEELAGFVYLTTPMNVVSIGEGTNKSVSVSIKNANEPILDGYAWTSSNPGIVDVIDSGATAVFTGNGIGTAMVTVTNKACQYPLNIIVQVVDPIAASANPYIQLSSSVITVPVSSNYTSITADLVGGTQDDFSSFIWKVQDSDICAVYGQNEVGKIKALKAGQTYITVSHPKAAYSAQLLVVCDEVPTSDCYISVPSSIISIKPNASAQTITASLVNGTTTDKYNFSWSLDVYDVIDFQYSANVCTITPLQTGTVTITIRHPKAAYEQQVIVNVQEYSEFSFPQENVSLTQGTVVFETMEVPTTTLSTHVEYSVDNSKICSITGTKSVAQITGISAGTTTVRAKLIASSTGTVQATSEMLVYVKEAPVNAVYISSSSTIYTVNKGKSQTLSATLTGNGVTAADQANIKWTTSDTDIIQITGINTSGTVTGQSIYIKALKPGEALITCSHSKAASALQFYVVVPGTAEKVITLNKTYMTLTKGSSGSQLKATIENMESSNEYGEIIWNCEKNNGVEIARIMGNGQTVTVYPIAAGETTVTASLPDSKTVAKCTIIVEAGKSFTFETSSKKVQPYHSKKVQYTVSPVDAVLTWTTSQDDDYFSFQDLGCDDNGVGYVEISGIKEGAGTLACVTNGSAKGSITVKVAWDYEFELTGTTTFSIKPTETKQVGFKVNPADADIKIASTDSGLFDYEIANTGTGTGTITIKPKSESSGNISINVSATNPNKDNETIGSKAITAKFQYSELTPTIAATGSQPGKYSYWNIGAKTLTVGDGESIALKFDISETKANGKVTNVVFKNASGANSGISAKLSSSENNYQIYTIEHPTDSIDYVYRITKAYIPTYNGQPILDWKTSLAWCQCCDHGKSWGNEYCLDYFGLVSKNYSSIGLDYTSGTSYYSADYAKWLIM